MNHFHAHSKDLERLLEDFPTYEQASEITDILSVLADPTRLRILWLLCHTKECVNDIAEAIGMSAPAVSHHLKLLKQTKIIEAKKEGKEMIYTLTSSETARLIHKLVDAMFEMNCPNLAHED